VILARHQATLLAAGQLPGYAHDLNPMEPVWGNLKITELANLCPDIFADADTAAHTGLHRIPMPDARCPPLAGVRQCRSRCAQ
jgi:hypothetical protein